MPAVTSGLILVTGATGYIGAWVVKYLVEQSYSVIVAARSESQIDFVTNRFPEYAGKASGIVVPMIEAPGAYDEAVKNVDGIIHVASPVTFDWQDPSEVIEPAVKGTTGILASAAKFGKKVKRVVITSSSGAVALEEKKEGVVYDENDWNTAAVGIVERDGRQASPMTMYTASKTLAERAAWNFMESEKPSFDLTVINPVYNLGPFIHEVTKVKGVASSLAAFLNTLPDGDTSGDIVGDWVDVRDVAVQHVLALSTPAAGGERIISAAHTFAWQDLYDILNSAGFKNIPGKDTHGTGNSSAETSTLSGAKALRIFPGFAYRSLDESVREMGYDLVKAELL